ncbi:MAG: RidA family protein [Acidimicrobiales bacterium]
MWLRPVLQLIAPDSTGPGAAGAGVTGAGATGPGDSGPGGGGTSAPPPPVAHYRPVVRAGDWLVVSGQLGLADGRLVDGLDAQTRQALTNLAAVLASEGAGLGQVVKASVFLRHIEDFAAMNRVYAEVFGSHRPARSAVAVAGLPLGALVEIEAWAHHRASA